MRNPSQCAGPAILLLIAILPSATMAMSLYAGIGDTSPAAAQPTTQIQSTLSTMVNTTHSTAATKPGRRGGLPPGLAKAWAHSNMSVVARAVTRAIFLNDTHGTVLSRIAINASSTNQLIKDVAHNQTVVHIRFDRDGSVVLVVNASAKPFAVYADDLKLSEKLSALGLTPNSEAWVYDNVKRIIIIFADPLTITISYPASIQPTATTSTTQPGVTPLCIIATAAFGTPLALEVQLLRDFRDHTLSSTFVGSRFMQVFNRFYYSFSPAVALLIVRSPTLSQITRLLIGPLIMIIRATLLVCSSLGLSAEPAMVLSGILASGLIGVSYMTPLVTVAAIWKKRSRIF